MLIFVFMSLKITGFFDHQYIRRSTKVEQSALDFLVRDSNQRKVECKTATAGWMWLGNFNQTQISLDLPWVGFGAYGDGMATLELIQNEILNED